MFLSRILFAMSATYPVPATTLEQSIEVKKSRFIARAAVVSSREEAMTLLAEVRAAWPDARHHCWAYLLGNPAAASSAAMNDDGEPSGTAGRPILNVIQHKGIGDVMVVVSRYFGGIKLGAGGLTRAYGAAAEAVLSALPLMQQVPMHAFAIRCDFAREQPLRHWVAQHGGSLGEPHYDERVCFALELPAQESGALKEFCAAQGILCEEVA